MAGGDGGEGSWTAGAAANEVASVGSVILTSLVIRWVASYIAKGIVRPHRRTAQEMQVRTTVPGMLRCRDPHTTGPRPRCRRSGVGAGGDGAVVLDRLCDPVRGVLALQRLP